MGLSIINHPFWGPIPGNPHIYIHIYIYIIIHIHIYIYIYVCTYVRIYVSIYVSIYLSISLSIYLSIYVSVYLCIYVRTTESILRFHYKDLYHTLWIPLVICYITIENGTLIVDFPIKDCDFP